MLSIPLKTERNQTKTRSPTQLSRSLFANMFSFDCTYTISIVEGEAVLRQEMAFQLAHQGFRVESFENAAGFYRYLAVRPNTIAVLDIGLPGEDGIAICQYLRTHDPMMGIVFVTASGRRDERLTGFAAGADAYLTKPVDMDELVLILRRFAMRFAAHKNVNDLPRRGNDHSWSMEPNSVFLTSPNGIRIKLSACEGQLLRKLLEKPGMPCTHAELGVALGLHPGEFDKHRIEVILSRLSGKVARSSGLELPLQSFRNVGYGLLQHTDFDQLPGVPQQNG